MKAVMISGERGVCLLSQEAEAEDQELEASLGYRGRPCLKT